MLEDIKDAIEKRRDLEVKDMQGATAVGFQYDGIKCLCIISQTTLATLDFVTERLFSILFVSFAFPQIELVIFSRV